MRFSFHRRPDGTVLTRNCDQGLRDAGRRLTARIAAVMTAIATVIPAFAQDAFKPQPLIQILYVVPPDSSALAGIVTDVTGAPIPDALITVTSASSTDTTANWKRTAKTDNHGHYRIAGLTPAAYSVEIWAPGFQTFRANKEVKRATDLAMDAEMRVSILIGTVVEVPEPAPTPRPRPTLIYKPQR